MKGSKIERYFGPGSFDRPGHPPFFHPERYTFQTQRGDFRARISGQNFRPEAGEFQTHVRGVSDAHNGAFQTHYGIMV